MNPPASPASRETSRVAVRERRAPLPRAASSAARPGCRSAQTPDRIQTPHTRCQPAATPPRWSGPTTSLPRACSGLIPPPPRRGRILRDATTATGGTAFRKRCWGWRRRARHRRGPAPLLAAEFELRHRARHRFWHEELEALQQIQPPTDPQKPRQLRRHSPHFQPLDRAFRHPRLHRQLSLRQILPQPHLRQPPAEFTQNGLICGFFPYFHHPSNITMGSSVSNIFVSYDD